MLEVWPGEIAEESRQDQTGLADDVTVTFQVQGLQLCRMGQNVAQAGVIQGKCLLMGVDIQAELAKILKDIE